jgi:nicotinamide riboside transporter PnuC
MLALTTLLPLVVVGSIGFMPRLATSRLSMRHREHWLAPERRAATMATLANWACAFGVLLILFLTGIHLLTVEANARVPARLDEATFFVVLVAFLVLLAAWIGFMVIRFGRPR